MYMSCQSECISAFPNASSRRLIYNYEIWHDDECVDPGGGERGKVPEIWNEGALISMTLKRFMLVM